MHVLSWLIAAIAIFYAVVGAAVAVLLLQCRRRRPRPLPPCPGRLLVVAPHPDDGVVMAAGQAMDVLGRGGAVRIVYLTTGARRHDHQLRRARQAEACAAWAELGVSEASLVFLGYEGDLGLVDPQEIAAAIDAITLEVREFQPGRIVVPLYEGGHYQHDVANFIVAKALAASGIDAELYEAPEYNFYVSCRTTPHKLLAILSGFVPRWRHVHPPEPVDDRTLYAPSMSSRELALKATMLRHFTTQSPEALVHSAGGADRVQRYRAHDYRRPPFRYAGSLAWWVDGLKRWPLLGPFLAARFRRTRTIHPDPDCRISLLPVDAIEQALADRSAPPELTS
jgi:LmbE family N-acetylglucosaminyl deacetylase